MHTLLDSLRAKLVAWAREASLEQLGKLPEELFNTFNTQVTEGENGSSKLPRIRKRVRTSMTRADADHVRSVLAKYEKGSEKYFEARDKIARETRFTRKQIGAAMVGLESAAKRKEARKK
ncbi:MAG: hypothetical protein A3G05_00345 [Candidatus Zambryskibacteria bacterium RIFCSPLOWO2_12_FULL_45_14]|uniref:Uncharacterized protein n=1 Tax=Candidatus Zambryskibacteria bacterium RIFCSPLOWO2_12_FULL_45_14 TaxID=1802778 RepID=A0A1G2UWZ0_9BACT|nr:MAG: hypothetical protein A3G05_00345 [Candidatus Zambryskibacteria bacterium RIFCSPLOWO2_12_FULL_45_14]